MMASVLMTDIMVAKYLVLFFLCSAVSGQTPVPYRPRGYVYLHSPSPKVVIEAVYDHLCDGSKANWPILQAVKDAFSADVEILIHIFPLPYHHNAYFVQEAGEIVINASMDKFEIFIDKMFSNQDRFLSGAVNMTEPQVKSAIAQLVEKETGVKKDTVMAGFDDDTIVRRSRYAWKYAAHRGITGTPQFIVNGVHYPDGADYTADDWKKMITQLMKTP